MTHRPLITHLPRITRSAGALCLVAGLALTGCSEQEETVAPYDRVGVPAVPDRTRPVVDGSLPDGDYWATAIIAVDDGRSLAAQLTQALFDPTCTAELGTDACSAGFAVIDTPMTELSIDPTDLAVVSVVAEDRRNFAIDGTELLALVSGGVPATGAPDDYAYVAYPFLVAVRDGRVVEARQIWVE